MLTRRTHQQLFPRGAGFAGPARVQNLEGGGSWGNHGFTHVERPEEVQAPPRAISPNRFRFRPLPQPAFGFRLRLPGAASTYLRSVLGASRNLESLRETRKSPETGKPAICEEFSFPHFHSLPCSL